MKNIILVSFFALVCLTMIVFSGWKNSYYTFL
ncbi:hypothetical protein J2S09_001721 [Bacillus fengqiuensis]|nr:hypothetical protein [Bacillus fengqiuensis]